MTPRHFAWQAWYNLTSTFVSRGRRGTNSHSPSFCVAGVALMVPGGALGPGFGACDAAVLCVAGVVQVDIHRRFTWQAWHALCQHTLCLLTLTTYTLSTHSVNTHFAYSHLHTHTHTRHTLSTHTSLTYTHTHTQDILCQHTLCHHTFTLVSRGRRGTQLTSTVVLRGRRGTYGTVWRAWARIWRL